MVWPLTACLFLILVLSIEAWFQHCVVICPSFICSVLRNKAKWWYHTISNVWPRNQRSNGHDHIKDIRKLTSHLEAKFSRPDKKFPWRIWDRKLRKFMDRKSQACHSPTFSLEFQASQMDVPVQSANAKKWKCFISKARQLKIFWKGVRQSRQKPQLSVSKQIQSQSGLLMPRPIDLRMITLPHGLQSNPTKAPMPLLTDSLALADR